MARYIPKQGDFIIVNFDPQSGHEQKGRRPALVVSKTEFNRHTGLAMEWCVVLSNSFQHLSFELVPWRHHSIVLLLSAFSLTRFEAIGSISDSMCRHSVEQLIVESLTAN